MPVTKITLRTTPAEYYAGLEHIADAVRRARETEDFVQVSWCPGDGTHYRFYAIPVEDNYTYVVYTGEVPMRVSYVPKQPPMHLLNCDNDTTKALLADVVNHSQDRKTRYYEKASFSGVPAPEWAESEAASG